MKNQNFRFHWMIDQSQILSNNLNIDIIDWSIYEVMKQFFLSGNCEKKILEGVAYYRYEWQNIPEQAPILGLSTKQSVFKRYDKLADADLLLFMELADGTVSKRWFRFGEMHEKVMNTQADLSKAAESKNEYANKNKKLGTSNTVNARLQRKPSFTGVNDGLQKDLLSVNDGLHNNTIIENNETTPDKEIISPTNVGGIDENDAADFEEQIEAAKNAPPKSTATVAKKRKPAQETKWNGSFKVAMKIFVEQHRAWSLKRFGSPSVFVWDGIQIGHLSQFMTKLKSVAIASGEVFENDIDFVESTMPPFLTAAASLDKYYSNDFSPSLFSTKFNQVLSDIKDYLKNGNTGNTKGRNGHQFDSERTRYMESLLD